MEDSGGLGIEKVMTDLEVGLGFKNSSFGEKLEVIRKAPALVLICLKFLFFKKLLFWKEW